MLQKQYLWRKTSKIYIWPNSACIFLNHTWWSNKFDREMSDTCGHVTWWLRVFESFLDLNQAVQQLSKARIYFLVLVWPFWAPSNSNHHQNLQRGEITHLRDQMYKKWPILVSNLPFRKSYFDHFPNICVKNI